MYEPLAQTLTSCVAGIKTGPVTEPPPPVSKEVTSDILANSEKDPKGHNTPGQDGVAAAADGEPKKEKTEKERTNNTSSST